MAKKNLIQRELKRKFLFNKYNQKRLIIKKKISKSNDLLIRLKYQEALQKLPRNSLRIRLRNRCWKTGRTRGFYRDFGLSRHVFREMAHNGLLPGIRKASW